MFFTRPDQGLYGTSMQWSIVYDFVTCYLYPFMFSTGGEVWDPATGQVEGILDSDINAAAMVRNKSFLALRAGRSDQPRHPRTGRRLHLRHDRDLLPVGGGRAGDDQRRRQAGSEDDPGERDHRRAARLQAGRRLVEAGPTPSAVSRG